MHRHPSRSTSIRLNQNDQKVIDELRELTGLGSASEVIRVAVREALAARRRAQAVAP